MVILIRFLILSVFLLGPISGLRGDEKSRLVLMCLSAHPDDEDGLTLTSYVRFRDVQAYSIFFTRGEGGQNEIGSQLDEDLGKLRTIETMRAAGILGTQVYFLGFTDFGYSKTAKETFAHWGGKDSVLSRLVEIIRAIKPDVIITNHDTITTLSGRQHGNHQVVGVTAYAAFSKASDSTYHPEQFRQLHLRPWQVKKLFMRARDRDTLSPVVTIDTARTDSLGKTMLSYAFAALAMHRSQGLDKFVAAPSPFMLRRHLYKLMESDRQYPFDSTDLFSGIEPTVRESFLPTETLIDTAATFSFSIDPTSSILVRPDEMNRQKIRRDVSVKFSNPFQAPMTVDLAVTLEHQKIFYKSYTLPPGTTTDNLHLTFARISGTAKKILHFDALPSEKTKGSSAGTATLTLWPLQLVYPHNVSIGLVATYDNTLEATMKSLHIPYQLLDSSRIARENLGKYSTIILDIRTYLERPDVVRYNERLMRYCEAGGHIVCFYHKTSDWNGHDYAPYPLQLTGERVTEENAPVTVLVPDHPLFTTPNRIVTQDWDGWVQERNIYLPSDDTTKTSSKYLRLLGMSDEDEHQPPTSLLWCKDGKGTYTYVALVLYRQLREMNEGAVKLFLNLISQPRQSH